MKMYTGMICVLPNPLVLSSITTQTKYTSGPVASTKKKLHSMSFPTGMPVYDADYIISVKCAAIFQMF